MKISEIGRYQAAKELTRVVCEDGKITFATPFGSPRFTIRVSMKVRAAPRFVHGGTRTPLKEVTRAEALADGCWLQEGSKVTMCFNLPKGTSFLEV